jgi:hypothetical protein
MAWWKRVWKIERDGKEDGKGFVKWKWGFESSVRGRGGKEVSARGWDVGREGWSWERRGVVSEIMLWLGKDGSDAGGGGERMRR